MTKYIWQNEAETLTKLTKYLAENNLDVWDLNEIEISLHGTEKQQQNTKQNDNYSLSDYDYDEMVDDSKIKENSNNEKTEKNEKILPKFQVLTDISGFEDHYGGMDFKVAGTKTGITALQLDNKEGGLPIEILAKALQVAKQGRLHILQIMHSAIQNPRETLSELVPTVSQVLVPLDKIREVIGSGGAVINKLQKDYSCQIDLDNETGETTIYGQDRALVLACQKAILNLVKVWKTGDFVFGQVFRLEQYGAFVKLAIDPDSQSIANRSFKLTEKEGLIHISQLSTRQIRNVREVVEMGNLVKCRILEINEKGQLALSLVEKL